MDILDIKTHSEVINFIDNNTVSQTQLLQIVDQLKLEIPNNLQGTNSAIVYSGILAAGEHSGSYANAIAEVDNSIAVINKTEVYKLLDDPKSTNALTHAWSTPIKYLHK